MDNLHTFPSFGSSGEKKQPIALISHLMQQLPTMRQINEFYFWLANALVYHLDIAAVQIWMTHADVMGRVRVELRGAFSQNPALPQYVYYNKQMATMVERLYHEKRSTPSISAAQLFTPEQMSVLTYFQLNYWASRIVRGEVLFAARRTEFIEKQHIIPDVVLSLFTTLPLAANQERAVNFVIEQALRLAVERGLLVTQPDVVIEDKGPDGTAVDMQAPALTAITPRHMRDMEQMQAENPFANAPIIPDKNARKVYQAIDDTLNADELLKSLRLREEEMISALEYLFYRNYIQLCKSDGDTWTVFPFPSVRA